MIDASKNIAINAVTILDQRRADQLRVPVGEVVSWAKAYPRPEHQKSN